MFYATFSFPVSEMPNFGIQREENEIFFASFATCRRDMESLSHGLESMFFLVPVFGLISQWMTVSDDSLNQ